MVWQFAGLTEERKTELNGEYEAKMKECEELRADIDPYGKTCRDGEGSNTFRQS